MNKMKKVQTSDQPENTDLKKQIHQYYIDLQSSHSLKDVKSVITNCFLYLDKELDINTTDEIFGLILFCLSFYSDPLFIIFNKFFENVKINSNRIVISASILSYLIIEKQCEPTINYKSFVSASYEQITNQIKKKSNILIFEQTIPTKFESDFVIDILSLSPYNKNHSRLFHNYISSHSNISNGRINRLIQIFSTDELLSLLPTTYYNNFSTICPIEFLYKLIPKIAENELKQILQKVTENQLINDQNLKTAILKRCVELNINIEESKDLINSLSAEDLDSNVLKYLIQFKIILPEKVAKKVKSFPNTISVIKIMPSIENIPQNLINRCLLRSNKLKITERLLSFNLQSNFFHNKLFWLNIVKTVSCSSKTFSEETIKKLSIKMQENLNKDRFVKVLNEMIFSVYPPNKNVCSFLSILVKNFEEKYQKYIWESNNLTYVINKVIDSEQIPIPSFWNIFDLENLNDLLFSQNIELNTIYFYALEFSCNRNHFKTLKTISLKPINNVSRRQLFYLIQSNDIDSIVSLNDE